MTIGGKYHRNQLLSSVRTTACLLITLVILPARSNLRAENGLPSFREISMGQPSGNYASVAMADIDRDGRAEILSGCREAQEGLYLFSYKNKGWVRTEINPHGQYGGVALADVTGDGTPDVLAARNGHEDRIKGLEFFEAVVQNQTIGFKARKSPYSSRGCDDLTVGDIELDGDLDIALATGGDGVKLLLNNGNAFAFQELTLATDTYEDTAIALADLNRDQRLDVVVTNHPGKNPRVFLCSAQGTVSYSTAYVDGLNIPSTIGYEPAVADFDADGNMDLAIGTNSGLEAFLGNRCQGAESSWWRRMRMPNSSQTMQVCVGDINRDGQADIIASSATGILVLLNSGAGAFSVLADTGLPQKGEYSGCCLCDWDGDGDLDVACSSFQGLGIRFFENL